MCDGRKALKILLCPAAAAFLRFTENRLRDAAAFVERSAVCLYDFPQEGGHSRMLHDLPGSRSGTVREELMIEITDAIFGKSRCQSVAPGLKTALHIRRDGMAVFRELDGRLCHLRQRHGSVIFQKTNPSRDTARKCGAVPASGRYSAGICLGAQILFCQIPRGEARGAHPVKLPSGPDDRKIIAAEGRGRWLHNRKCNGNGHACVNGIASLFQDPDPGRSCQRMGGSHHGICRVHVSSSGRKGILIWVVGQHKSPLLSV